MTDDELPTFVSYVSPENAKIVPSPALEALIESARYAQRREQQRHAAAGREALWREIAGWPVLAQGESQDFPRGES